MKKAGVNDGATTKKRLNTIDEYIAVSPTSIRDVLEKIRQAIKESAPEAEEAISYGIPAFRLGDRELVYFAAWKNHVGFYPTPSGAEAFKKELSLYKQGKGSVQFPLDKPIPYDLVKKIVRYKVKENIEKMKGRKQLQV
jgi:uncharacterized protein YdhG (YjbR/CyaY superfamily)